MRFGLLGPVEAIRDGEPLPLAGGKPRALLALLLLNAGRVMSTERIVDDLWGENPPDSAVKMVQILVSQLRKQLGRQVVATRGAGYLIELKNSTLDVDEFNRLAEQGREELPINPVAAAATLRAALALWRGPALAEFEEPFAAVEISRLEEAWLTCLEDRIEADLATGEHRDLVGELSALTQRFPLRPRLHGQLMLALYRSDRHAEALAAYRSHREQLDELGLEPSPQLRELERRMLQQDPTLDVPELLATSGLSVETTPWDAHGELLERDDPIEVLTATLAGAARTSGRIVLVTGEPGIGKTALVTTFLRNVPLGTRVLYGTCDDLSIPRPLGPFLDLAGAVSPAFAQEISTAEAPHEFHARLLSKLARPSSPTVLVLEDIHWADDATIDAITLLGRRIGSLPVVLVLTFRTGEAPPAHRLHAAIGALSADGLVRLDLPPLSAQAVATLAGEGAGAVFEATGGNPFYVREVLASRDGGEIPQSIVNAVRGRASRLDEESRRLVDLVSMVPHRVSGSLLDRVLPNWATAAIEPERRQLLEVGASYVSFRHELARHAIRSSLPIAARRQFHQAILVALLESDSDPTDIVHHAEAAGAEDVVAEYATVAARRAAALGSNREAYSHYKRAAELAGRLPPLERASLDEELAHSAHLTGRMDEAFQAIEQAIVIYRELDDAGGVGRCLRARSHFHWFAGEGEEARHAARESIAILEPLGPSVELARAYSALSALSVVAQRLDDTTMWGERALALASELGDERTRAHALVNLGTVRMILDPNETQTLVEAHAVGDAAGDYFEAARALCNLAGTLLHWIRPEQAMHYAQRAITYAEEREVHTITAYVGMMVAWLRLRAGEWGQAERLLRLETADTSVAQLLADTSLAELAVRRGDANASSLLAELMDQAARTGELQRVIPIVELTIELALTSNETLPTQHVEAVVEMAEAHGGLTGWDVWRVPAWAAVAGVTIPCPSESVLPFSAMASRDWRAAADYFGAVGWPYDRALMLSLLDEADALDEAGAIAERLGAKPLWRRVAARRHGRDTRAH